MIISIKAGVLFLKKIRYDFRYISLFLHLLSILMIANLFVVQSYGQNTKFADACPPVIPERLRTPSLVSKAGRVSGILEELAKHREHFLATGDAVDLFPLPYFHSTKAEFDRAISGESLIPEITLDLIIAFYEAYEMNRMRFDSGGAESVEKHWKRYYRGAVAANRSHTKSEAAIAAILLDGVDAHIVYDLPRAIRSIVSTSPKPLAQLKLEYDKMDMLFYDVAERTNRDIVAGRKVAGQVASLDKVFGLSANYVIHSRNLAWELAVSGKRLPTKREQPFFEHDDRSRVYFAVDSNDPRCKTKPNGQ